MWARLLRNRRIGPLTAKNANVKSRIFGLGGRAMRLRARLFTTPTLSGTKYESGLSSFRSERLLLESSCGVRIRRGSSKRSKP